jgi:hypothetical protein
MYQTNISGVLETMMSVVMLTAYGLAVARAACSNTRAIDFAPTCSATELSSCSLGDTFANTDMSDLKKYAVAVQFGVQRRAQAKHIVSEKISVLQNELQHERHRLFKDKSNSEIDQINNVWQRFLVYLIDSAEKAKLRNEDTGFCGEAAKASIVQSIWKQLKTGKRESIQFVEIFGSSESIHNPNHNFVIYNGAPIKEQKNLNNEQMAKLLENLDHKERKNPVMICDSWIGFHGDPGGWRPHFMDTAKHPYSAIQWNRIVATDMSIPSLRDNLTADQRKFFMKKMKEILEPVIHPDISHKETKKPKQF